MGVEKCDWVEYDWFFFGKKKKTLVLRVHLTNAKLVIKFLGKI